jgi:uncharacterized lipoprotein YmbA
MKPIMSFFLALIAVAVAGCGTTPPAHFYSLNSPATADSAPAVECSVIVGPVFVPAAVDRPQFALTTGPNRVAFDEFNRWDAPLADGIARAVSGDLRQLLGAAARVTTAPMPDFGPAYHVTLRIERLESVRGAKGQNSAAAIEMVWALRSPSGDKVSSGTVTAQEPAPGNDYAALAAAHSRVLAKAGADIATAIRAAAAGGNAGKN